jgi:hypothetical protein
MLLLPTSIGDAVDKLTILEIKFERIRDEAKRENVKRELTFVATALAEIALELDCGDLRARLKGVNAELWDVEDAIREHERRGDFASGFVHLARSVYRLNDRRAQLKREINLLYGSAIVEEKAYVDYDQR